MTQNDLWIAATAHVSRTTLLSTDKDFDHLGWRLAPVSICGSVQVSMMSGYRLEGTQKAIAATLFGIKAPLLA